MIRKDKEIIVKLSPELSVQQQKDILLSFGCTIDDHLACLNIFYVTLPYTSCFDELSQHSSIEYVEENVKFKESFAVTPNDTFYSYQWHYPLIRLPQAWEYTTGSKNVRIAVIDTGVQLDHPDLIANLDADGGYDFVNDKRSSYDDEGHGTHVAGTIGAVGNNNLGITGVMWDVTMVPIKALDHEGYGYSTDIANAILYAAGLTTYLVNPNPVDIINLSLGGGYSHLMEDAIQHACNAGVLVVAATGNENTPFLSYPAALETVIAVGATDFNGGDPPNRAYYSNYGNGLDIMAPGGDMRYDLTNHGYADGVLSTGLGTQYQFMQGTSMACPHVVGVIGLMLSHGINKNDVKDILCKTAIPMGQHNDFEHGHGLINPVFCVQGIDTIQVLVGQRIGDTINAVAKGFIEVNTQDFSLDRIPTGKHKVFAWIDTNKNNRIDVGDFLAETEEIDFDSNVNIQNLHLSLSIVKNGLL